ncbi:MAG: ribosome maturation factor RimP [Coriobacteriales bacterium]|nr:ribosome maturation factor RimP [Coriobacteriales bacterium]
MKNSKITTIIDALEGVAADNGYELVDIELGGSGRHAMLRVYLDRSQGLTLDDIADANSWVSAAIEQLDPFKGSYTLEVSSPGIDRPLRTIEHFRRAQGQEVQVMLEPFAAADGPKADKDGAGRKATKARKSKPKARKAAVSRRADNPDDSRAVDKADGVSRDDSTTTADRAHKAKAERADNLDSALSCEQSAGGERLKYTGTLLDVDASNGLVQIEVDGRPIALPYSRIKKAHIRGRVDFDSRKEA